MATTSSRAPEVPGLRPFSVAALLGGARIYEFAEFYEAKNALLRYDDRRDYLNYGLWNQGDATANPSAALVEALAEAAEVGQGDVVLTLGSGLGQPDLDLAARGVASVIGVNVHAGQVAYANARARDAGVHEVVRHVHGDAQRLSEVADGLSPTHVLAVESLAEMPDVGAVLEAAYRVLRPGGRLALCDVVALEDARGRRRAVNRVLCGVTSVLYGDSWRTPADYEEGLSSAGFVDIRARRIGGDVYAPTFRYARARMRALRRLRRRAAATTIAYVNLRALERLYAIGAIDYVIVSARKPPA